MKLVVDSERRKRVFFTNIEELKKGEWLAELKDNCIEFVYKNNYLELVYYTSTKKMERDVKKEV